MQLDEGLLAVVVVGVDDGERGIQNALAGQHSLAGTPGFGTAFGQRDAGRQGVQFLVGVGNLNAKLGADAFDPVPDCCAESIGNIVADDEHNLVEACFDGVMD